MDLDDLMVGHCYFFADDDEQLALQVKYEVIPLKKGGLKYHKNFDHMKESFESLMVAETMGLRKNLSYLDTIVTMAPLLGLLGTVMGMIGSFQVLDIAGSNPSVITGSVGEALIATASGLCVAVLALTVHSYFTP